MGTEQKLMEQAGLILQERGRFAVDLARRSMLTDEVAYPPLRDALRYFSEDWNDFLHPALVSLACEAVGGKPRMTDKLGAALVLLAGGADIHDDIIDQSVVKGIKETVFGKFGKDIAILAGDIFLLKGIYLLHEGCENLETFKKRKILNTVNQTFLETSSAEATEAALRGRIDIQKQQFLDIIHHKVAAGETAMRIGALIGNGTSQEVETLADYGRSYGTLMSIRDEFVDIFEQDELSNRIRKEVLPLPIIVALQDDSKNARLLQLLKEKINANDIEEVVDLTSSSIGSTLLVSEMKYMSEQLIGKIKNLRYCRENLRLLAVAALEDL